MVRIDRPVAGSQSRTVRSVLAEARICRSPTGTAQMSVTGSECPEIGGRTGEPSSGFHSRTVQSAPPEASRYRPATSTVHSALTPSPDPAVRQTNDPSVLTTLIVPSLSAEAMQDRALTVTGVRAVTQVA